ncbi:MAG: SDR family oxidoreductase [Verrucomicrobia bacterium]|nr:MAG: SDR family oxidoreductase [Verrucomicrobiota bacterium]
MRILILGGAGMLGHQLWRSLHRDHEVWVTLRKPLAHYASHGLFEADRTLSGVDVCNADSLEGAFRAARPEAVVNCIGIIKQLKEAHDPFVSLAVNSMLPHRVARLCAVAGARMVHVSTDCVFSGRRGGYTESDASDANDLYGRTKFLGEVAEPHCVTLRTSIIGRELETKSGLIEWFLSQRGKTIHGYRKAIYSGFTTHELSRLVRDVLVGRHAVSGLWQVSSDPIDKHALLDKARGAFRWEGEIVPDDSVVCDRSLDSTRFRNHTGYRPPTWDAMLEELASSPN